MAYYLKLVGVDVSWGSNVVKRRGGKKRYDGELVRYYFYDKLFERFFTVDVYLGKYYVGSWTNNVDAWFNFELVEEETGRIDKVVLFV